ncbi:MAG: hypothetical protein QG597_4451 [Actinomycetota bacterium]|jgi:uncharacterized protein YbjQ (UPF0145 family)|nr:hypothetical protein [Actinomycetota bacterium]
MQTCGCGLVKQSRAGTSINEGVETCNNCGKPIHNVGPLAPLARPPVDVARVTTLAALPGHRILAAHGTVSMLSGSSGLTATTKGNEALSGAMTGLRWAASEMGGNAIVGLQCSSFGAAGGITSAFGGDAVGVLLLGTAVTVEADTHSSDASPVFG